MHHPWEGVIFNLSSHGGIDQDVAQWQSSDVDLYVSNSLYLKIPSSTDILDVVSNPSNLPYNSITTTLIPKM